MGRKGGMGRRMALRASGGPQLARGARKAGLIGAHAQQRLTEAQDWMKNEEYAKAADAYAALSNGAATKSMPAMALMMKLTEAQAQLSAGQVDAACDAAREAITLSQELQDTKRAARKFAPFLSLLEAAGHKDNATSLQKELLEQFGLKAVPDAPTGAVNRSQRRNLPKRCAVCQTFVQLDKIEWNEDNTADCTVCGSTLHK